MHDRSLWQSTQKARKQHFCDYCCNYIYPGQTYTREIWAYDQGFFIVMRQHAYPSHCPPNPTNKHHRQMMEEEEEMELGIPISLVGEVREVVMIGRDGKAIIQSKTHFAPIIVVREEVVIENHTDDDCPF